MLDTEWTTEDVLDRWSTSGSQIAQMIVAEVRASLHAHDAEVRAKALTEFEADLIAPAANLDASVRAFKDAWHQADIEGRQGERVADGLRNVLRARAERGEQ